MGLLLWANGLPSIDMGLFLSLFRFFTEITTTTAGHRENKIATAGPFSFFHREQLLGLFSGPFLCRQKITNTSAGPISMCCLLKKHTNFGSLDFCVLVLQTAHGFSFSVLAPPLGKFVC